MAQRKTELLVAVVAFLVVCNFFQSAFVPSPARRVTSVALPVAAVAAASAPAFADQIGDAGKKLADAAYPFMTEVNWNSQAYLLKPGTANALEWLKAIDKAIVMGAAMDPQLLKEGVMAHHRAIGRVTPGNPVLPKEELAAINAALGRMVASVPEQTTMDVYDSFSKLVSKDVPPFLMSTVKEGDAKKAYAALMDFKDVVKSNPITPKAASVQPFLVQKLAPIDAAASKLSSAAYPLIKDVDWTSDLALKPLPGVGPDRALRAIDKALIMGASMDSALLKQAAEAHHKAIGSVDAKLVTSSADFEAVNSALGKLIASVPTSQVMDVYNAFGRIVDPVIPNYLYSSVNPADAQAAYAALLSFKDVVKSAQR